MIKVLFVGSFLSSKRGTKDVSETVAEKLYPEGIEISLTSRQGIKLLRIIEIVWSILKNGTNKTHVNIFSGQAFRIAEIASVVAKWKKQQIIFSLHGGALAEFEQKFPDRIRNVFLRANRIQTPSLFLQEYFNRKGYSVAYLPNSINLKLFPYQRTIIEPFKLLWVRAFSEVYNPHIVIKILNEVRKKYPLATLTMIGPDKNLLASTKALAKKLNVYEFVDFVGPVPNEELYKYYQTHSVYLNTTSYESFGVALVEAASCGIPMISTSVGEIPFLWTNTENILLVDDFDEVQFAQQIERIFEQPEFANQISINARKRAEKFDWELIKPDWCHILKSDLGLKVQNQSFVKSTQIPNILFVGSFLSEIKGSKSIAEKLGLLMQHKIPIQLTSRKENKVLRLLDIINTIFFFNGKIVIIDVYSGLAFRIAEVASLFAQFKKKRIIMNLRGGKLSEFAELNESRIKKLFSRASYIQTPSLFLKNYFEEKNFEIHYLPNPIDLKLFPFERKQVRPFSILWVRAFSHIYNPELAVRIFYEVQKEYPEATFTMVGPDKNLLAKTKRLVSDLNLENKIEFVGSVPNEKLAIYYQTHSVYLNTTSYESFGVAVVEAASCGIPIVSSSVGEMPYLWTHDKNILLVDELDECKFAIQVSRLFNDSELGKHITKEARLNAEQFNWELIKPSWYKLFQIEINN